MRTGKRALAVLLVLVLLFGVLFGFGSTLFLVREPVHTCCGQRCMVCGVFNAADALLRQSAFTFAFGLFGAAILLAAFGRQRCARRFRFDTQTPISLKTKLLN